MRLGSTERGLTGWTCRGTHSLPCSARSSLAVVTTGRHSGTFAQVSIWKPNESAGRRQANPRPSARRTSTPTHVRALVSYSRWACGLVWLATKPLVQNRS
jgi:hypothetical protein